MTDEFVPVWNDQAFLRNVQYLTDRNLAARQSIYAFQRPLIDLPAAVLDTLTLTGAESVADIGCGNGAYLAELTSRGHHGGMAGIDASPGMLEAASRRAPGAATIVGDAMAVPLRTGSADVTLAMHMLYHVPRVEGAVAELRRVTAPGGRVVIGLNGGDHLRQLRTVINEVLAAHGTPAERAVRELVTLDDGEALAARFFGRVVRHDFAGELKLPGPGPVEDYVRSMTLVKQAGGQDQIVAEVISKLDFSGDGCTVLTRTGCLICS